MPRAIRTLSVTLWERAERLVIAGERLRLREARLRDAQRAGKPDWIADEQRKIQNAKRAVQRAYKSLHELEGRHAI